MINNNFSKKIKLEPFKSGSSIIKLQKADMFYLCNRLRKNKTCIELIRAANYASQI